MAMKKKPNFNHKKIEHAIGEIFEAIGIDWKSDKNTSGTPDRIARAMEELFEGCKYTNKEIVAGNKVLFDAPNDGLVVEKISGPGVNSMCSHHLLPMYDVEVFVGYIPQGKVIGLSKLARIVQLTGHRPSLQEKWGADVAECVSLATGAEDVAVVISAKHGCITFRGAKSDVTTKTAELSGRFKQDSNLRNEFYNIIRGL